VELKIHFMHDVATAPPPPHWKGWGKKLPTRWVVPEEAIFVRSM